MTRKPTRRTRSQLPPRTPRSHWSKPYGRRWKAKHPFLTLRQAEAYLAEQGLQEQYAAYRCDFCGFFHVGHKPNNHQSK